MAAAAAVTSVSFSALNHSSSTERKSLASFSRAFATSSTFLENGFGLRLRAGLACRFPGARASNPGSRIVVQCMCTTASSTDVPTVSETKLNFLKAYKRPIPSIYSNVLHELMVQQHLMRYKRTYHYDAVFGLGFVTVFDQLMDGYPSDEDRDAIFQAYIRALNEEPEQYRVDATKLEEWAKAQTASSLVDFASREGEVEGILKDIAERAGSGNFSYSRFFAVGLFRLLELTNATEPTILEKLCAALNINKRSVDRDLDVYRNLLSKLVQAKELLKEYVDREKKKREERAETQKADEAVKQCSGEPHYPHRHCRECHERYEQRDRGRFLTCSHGWQACEPGQGERFLPLQYHHLLVRVASRALHQSSCMYDQLPLCEIQSGFCVPEQGESRAHLEQATQARAKHL